MEYFASKSDNLNTQFNSVQKQLQALEADKTLSATDKNVRRMELEATATRIQEKYNALSNETGMTPEKLAEISGSYENLAMVQNAKNMNDFVLVCVQEKTRGSLKTLPIVLLVLF
jgi:GTP cyclohydrolase I